ncbi:MAG: hypothetical protein LBK60_11095 [Verrucomicrobiales bacterium]|jgi:hypothetical protein|nr:hypothetical protein [Verrucomicrobiales bacterium]
MAEAKNTVKVKVVNQPVAECGRVYQKGETLEVTPARAKALGKLVSK